MTFHTRVEALALLGDMEILAFEEEEKDRTLSSGDTQHWHVFHIIAKVK